MNSWTIYCLQDYYTLVFVLYNCHFLCLATELECLHACHMYIWRNHDTSNISPKTKFLPIFFFLLDWIHGVVVKCVVWAKWMTKVIKCEKKWQRACNFLKGNVLGQILKVALSGCTFLDQPVNLLSIMWIMNSDFCPLWSTGECFYQFESAYPQLLSTSCCIAI